MIRCVLGILVITGTVLLPRTPARGASETVIAICYLQTERSGHSYFYPYREDGKLLRQLTNDGSGQHSAPIFAPDGSVIVFTGICSAEPTNSR
jgi:Tol biopolymer transport system component